MLAQNANNRAAYLEEYSYQTKEDQEILHSLHRESSCQGQSPRRRAHAIEADSSWLSYLMCWNRGCLLLMHCVHYSSR